MSGARGVAAGVLLLAACSTDEKLRAPSAAGSLALEIRDTLEVVVEGAGAEQSVSVTPSRGHGVVADGATLAGSGRLEAFPEAHGELLTARFDGAAVADGPCGDRPVSLALSLYRREGNLHVGGSLTAYCGARTFHGVPARLLRIAGELPRLGQ
jgi:hypothetical protein